MRSTIIGKISVCDCCLFAYANGECCGDHEGPEPMSAIGAGYSVTLGLLDEEHREGCKVTDRVAGECDCEELGFSWSACDGCGSALGGTRQAMTLWLESHVGREVRRGPTGAHRFVVCSCGRESEPLTDAADWVRVFAGHAVSGELVPSPEW